MLYGFSYKKRNILERAIQHFIAVVVVSVAFFIGLVTISDDDDDETRMKINVSHFH